MGREMKKMKREGYTITDWANWYNFTHKKWSDRKGHKITRIIPHHMAGNLTLAQFNNIMASGRQMSPTVAVFTDGTVCAYDPEEKRPWTTGGWDADCCALTLEIANDQIGGQWHISDKAYNKAVKIMAEWCIRYGIDPVYTYRGKGINMHKDWAATACPGPFLENKIKSGQLEKDIRAAMAKLKGETSTNTDTSKKVMYLVQCGAFKVKQNATNLKNKLEAAGFTAIVKHENGYYKVQTGAFSKKANAEAQIADLKKKGFKAVLVQKG